MSDILTPQTSIKMKSKILNLIKLFTSNETIQDKLKYFSEKNESGYEKWLQHEFSYWLQVQQKHSVLIEDKIEVDKRKTIKDRLFIDLSLNLKNQKNDIYHAIELKVTKKDAGAVKQAVQDLLRLNNAKIASWYFRSVTSIAFVNNSTESEKYQKFWEKLEGTNQKSNWIFQKEKIGESGMFMYIFIWNVPPRDVNKTNYYEFTTHLLDAARKCSIYDFDEFMEKRKPRNALKSKEKKYTKAIENLQKN